MKQYRLKKEAVPFFKVKYSTAIHPFDVWDSIGIDMVALEEVSKAYITYGHKKKENETNSLSGWSQDNGAYYHFTIHFPSMKYYENDRFENGKMIRRLMDKIQDRLDNFYSDFVNEEQSN